MLKVNVGTDVGQMFRVSVVYTLCGLMQSAPATQCAEPTWWVARVSIERVDDDMSDAVESDLTAESARWAVEGMISQPTSDNRLTLHQLLASSGNLDLDPVSE